MPTPTYKPLATVTLGSSAASVTFSNIPATYKDLILVASTKTGVTTDNSFRVNGDSGGNYNNVVMFGTGSSTGSNSFANETFNYMDYSNSTNYGASISHFMDYSATDKHKTILNRYGTGENVVVARATRWASTTAITSITLFGGVLGSQSWQSGSTWALYGIVA
jgi:hypothetical protein